MTPTIGLCCKGCGTSLTESSVSASSSSYTCRQNDRSDLLPVYPSLLPEENGIKIEENIRAILTDSTDPDFAGVPITVSGVPFVTDTDFVSDNFGEKYSLGNILSDGSVTSRAYSQLYQDDLDSTQQPFIPGSSPTNNTSPGVGAKYDCYGKRCGAQVSIVSEVSIRGIVIGKAVQKLKRQTKNFDKVFVTNDNLIQIIDRKGTKYAVFVPFNDIYLKQFINV